MSQKISSKWRKQSVLMHNRLAASHIPETRRFSVLHLRNMLARYAVVVLKPVVGTGGHGVYKVERTGSGWGCHYGARYARFSRFDPLVRHLRRICRRRPYLIQRGIQLARIAGRPVDYRVKIIKTNDRWRITAMVGRLARPGLFVTNLCRGGTQLRFSEAVGHSLRGVRVTSCKRRLRHLTYTCTGELERAFPGIDQLGFDYGLDRNGRPWILEVNTSPH